MVPKVNYWKGRKERYSSFVWECIVWLIWKVRNAFVFRGEQTNRKKLIEEMKIWTWSWWTRRGQSYVGGRFKDWILNPVNFLIDWRWKVVWSYIFLEVIVKVYCVSFPKAILLLDKFKFFINKFFFLIKK